MNEKMSAVVERYLQEKIQLEDLEGQVAEKRKLMSGLVYDLSQLRTKSPDEPLIVEGSPVIIKQRNGTYFLSLPPKRKAGGVAKEATDE